MNKYQELFQRSFFDGVSSLTRETFSDVLKSVAILFSIGTFITGIGYALYAGGMLDFSWFDIEDFQDPAAMQDALANFWGNLFSSNAIFLLGGLYLLFILTSFWNQYLLLLVGENKIRDTEKSFGELFSTSISGELPKALGVNFIILIISTAISGVVQGLFPGDPAMSFLANLVNYFFMIKFIIALPAAVLGGASIGEALQLSFNSIPFGRVFLYLLIGFIALMALGIGMLMVVFLAILLFQIPILGPIISVVLGLLVMVLLYAIYNSTVLGLYYTHIDVQDDDEMEIEDHLLVE